MDDLLSDPKIIRKGKPHVRSSLDYVERRDEDYINHPLVPRSITQSAL